MTKMIQLHSFGGTKHLSLDSIDTKPLVSNEARIRVAATALTIDQLNFINGFRVPGEEGFQFPVGLGYEACGVVLEVSDDIDQSWLGKRVAPIGPYDFMTYPSLGDEIIVPANRLIEIPESLSDEEAAALWVPYLTAYPVLTKDVQKGDFVAIIAATSTVGIAAIQLIQSHGAIPIGTTRSQEKAEQLKALTGIEHVIITSQENYAQRIEEITGGTGTKLAFDPIGGEFITGIARGMAQRGHIIEYGVLGGMEAPLYQFTI